MKNIVTVLANKATGDIFTERTITDKNGETREVGVVMVQSKTLSGLSSLARVATRTAFITLEQDALEFLGDSLVDGAPFPIEGKICIEETLVPYVRKDGTKQTPKMNPTTQDIMTYQGRPVYRNSFFTEDLSTKDVFLKDSPKASSEDNEATE